jgi:hypothetical protein
VGFLVACLDLSQDLLAVCSLQKKIKFNKILDCLLKSWKNFWAGIGQTSCSSFTLENCHSKTKMGVFKSWWILPLEAYKYKLLRHCSPNSVIYLALRANIINYGYFYVNYGTKWSREEKITNYGIIYRCTYMLLLLYIYVCNHW